MKKTCAAVGVGRSKVVLAFHKETEKYVAVTDM